LQDIAKLVLIPVLMMLGIVLRWARVGIKARHLEFLIIYFAAPALLFTEAMKIELNPPSFGGLIEISLAYMGLCFSASYLLSRGLSSRERGTVVFNSTFFNSMFLPFPLIYAFYGDLSAAVLFSVPVAIVHNTIGIFLASYWGHGKVGRNVLVRAITYPPLVGFFVGFLAAPIVPEFVSTTAFDALRYIGISSVYLSLLFVGLVIPISRDSLFILRNQVSRLITVFRTVVSPMMALILILLTNPWGVAKETVIIMSLMPPAFTNMIITSRFGLDVKATSQSIFLPTFLSIGIVFALKFFALI